MLLLLSWDSVGGLSLSSECRGTEGKRSHLSVTALRDKAQRAEWYVSTVQFYLKCYISAFYSTVWFDMEMSLKKTSKKILQRAYKATSGLTGSVVRQGEIWQHFPVFYWAVGRKWYLLKAERKSSWHLFCCKIFWCNSLKLTNKRSFVPVLLMHQQGNS